MSAIKTEYTPGLWQYIGSMLVPVAATGIVLAVVAIGAGTVVVMAIGVEAVKAVAISTVCIGMMTPAALVGAGLVYNQHQHVKLLASMVHPEPMRIIEQPAARQLQPPQFPGVDRWTEVAPGHLVDAGSLRVMAETVYDQLWGQGRELTQANIKQVVPVTDNSQCTAICNDLAGRGLAYKESDAKTARWKWVREYTNG